MDFSILVILWIVFMLIEKFAKKNPSQKPDNNFEIPTLPNDPNFPDENFKIFQDEVKPAEFREKFPQPKINPENIFRRVDKVENKKNLPINLTPDSAFNAIILSEIFSKPKSLRK